MFGQSPKWLFWATGLLAGALLVGADIVLDARSGGSLRHLLSEVLILLLLSAGLVHIVLERLSLQRRVEGLSARLEQAEAEARDWKTRHQHWIQGLSRAIDEQFEKWKLTSAEKEIALLLIKGLSHKEIAEIRDTAEKTVRTHGASVYEKSGIRGRAELAAFFLEDLLAPASSQDARTSMTRN